MNRINLFNIIILILSLISRIQSGAVCWTYCWGICSMMGPFKFAAAFGVIFDFGGCSIMCGAACAAGVIVPPACFYSDTLLNVKEGNKIIKKNISEILPNDYIQTLNENNEVYFTKVMINEKSTGNFSFYQIIVKNSQTQISIQITDNHGMIILDEKSNKKIIRASKLKIGDVIMTKNGFGIIVEIIEKKLNEKYNLVTKDGTVLASEIFISTICESEIDENKNYKTLLNNWIKKHQYK